MIAVLAAVLPGKDNEGCPMMWLEYPPTKGLELEQDIGDIKYCQ